jgi:hypothetical protein
MPCWMRRGVCVPVDFAGRDSCVAMERTGETCRMTSGNQPTPSPSVARWCCAGGPQRAVARRGCEGRRGSQGRAGVHPRRKQTVLGPTTACAGSIAQFWPYDVDVRAIFRGPLVTNHSPARQYCGGSLVTAFPWPPAVWRPALGVRQQCGG